ncbi:MRP49 [Candida oxycetoniae]|uniref:MRP49 n=1 Tax=Candida oxycetoniae TaxID=497107 RepID=A0AAI9WYH1_9ASCO|nr:MRP49 [Candida oxycetoniae]KAI3405134.2 MRP49 [Candida oxycetoniae]
MSQLAAKYTPKITRQIKRVNNLRGRPSSSFKFDASKFKEFEFFIYHQNPYIYKPASGILRLFETALPTLRYHNPDVQFTITKVEVNDPKELLELPLMVKIYGENPENVQTIDCTNKPPHQILNELVELTNARKLKKEEIPFIPLRPTKR